MKELTISITVADDDTGEQYGGDLQAYLADAAKGDRATVSIRHGNKLMLVTGTVHGKGYAVRNVN